jgi:uncharacterized protein YcbK (DUF882 family)
LTLDQLYKCEKYDIPSDVLPRLLLLLEKLNQLEAAMGRKLVVTNGYRTWPEHKAIYQKINDARLVAKKPELPIPLHSKHLSGDAADLYDPDQTLKTWAGQNVPLLERIGFWCEAFHTTPNWLHVQQEPPLSGQRFFNPYA